MYPMYHCFSVVSVQLSYMLQVGYGPPGPPFLFQAINGGFEYITVLKSVSVLKYSLVFQFFVNIIVFSGSVCIFFLGGFNKI